MAKKSPPKHLLKAWESRRNYYTYNGITDSRTGWTKRLGLTPTAFGNRLALFKAGKITEDLMFRHKSVGLPVRKKYESKISPEARSAICRANAKKAHPFPRLPENRTIRCWNTVVKMMQAIKNQDAKNAVKNGVVKSVQNYSWSRFFIDRFGLKMPFELQPRF